MLCNTYRYRGHHVGDINREYYRSKQEEQTWKSERDPIKVATEAILAQNIADRPTLDQIQAEVKAEIDKAVQFAMAAPYPNTSGYPNAFPRPGSIQTSLDWLLVTTNCCVPLTVVISRICGSAARSISL